MSVVSSPVRSHSLTSSPRKFRVSPLNPVLTSSFDHCISTEDSDTPHSRPHKPSPKIPGYAFFFFGSPRFDSLLTDSLASRRHIDYSPLHLSDISRKNTQKSTHFDLKNCTLQAKLRKIRNSSRIREKRIKTAQINKKQQLAEIKGIRVENLRKKQEKMDIFMHKEEFLTGFFAWVRVVLVIGTANYARNRVKNALVRM